MIFLRPLRLFLPKCRRGHVAFRLSSLDKTRIRDLPLVQILAKILPILELIVVEFFRSEFIDRAPFHSN